MNERKLTIILISSLSVIVIGGSLLLYYFHFGWLAEVEQQISVLQGEVDDAKDKKGKLPDLKKSNETLTAEIKKGEDRIPRLSTGGWQDEKGLWHFEYDDFVNLLDTLRKSANVFVSNSKFTAMGRGTPGQGALPASVHKVTYDLNVKGTWFNLVRFVNLLESQKRIVAIEKFSFKPGSEEKDAKKKGPMRHDLQVKVVSYTYRDVGAGTVPGATAVKTGPDGAKPPQEASRTTLPPD